MRNIDPSLIALLDEVRKAYESIPERFRESESVHVLVRVVAKLVPGVEAVSRSTSWLKIPGRDYVIDVLPVDVYPGPILVRLGGETNAMALVGIDLQGTTNEYDKECAAKVAEIVDATEGARRFLSMP